MKADLQEVIELPEGVQASYADGKLSVQGKAGQIERKLRQPGVTIAASGNTVTLSAKGATQREKRLLFTARSHIRNMIRGSQDAHTYKLKICSGHFPMNVSVGNGEIVVKNFLGEAVPRKLKLKEGVDVKLDGDIIIVTSPDKEIAGHQAADIEQLTRITNRDRRIFQDGIYITEKDGKVL